MASKRKATAITAHEDSDSYGNRANKRPAIASHKKARVDQNEAITKGHINIHTPFINRDFYPAEMSNERCEQYNNNQIPRPYDELVRIIGKTKVDREKVKPAKAVLFWFKRDLRLSDNRGLALAAKTASSSRIPLVCLFIVSSQDYEAHFTSPARVDFELRTLEILKQDLAALDIPLVIETIDERKKVSSFVWDLCNKLDVKHVICNIEYEVDELRREAMMIKAGLHRNISFTPVHDDLVVMPGELTTGSGKQYSVFTPWFRTWKKYVLDHPHVLHESSKPDKNPPAARELFKDLFDSPVPNAPPSKALSADRKQYFARLWPAGEHEARQRVHKFAQEKIKEYHDARNSPAGNHTAKLSVHHSAGTLNPRTSIRIARDVNSSKSLDSGNPGVLTWISEVAWRDFYKHVLAHWPYVCMFKPFKYEYSNIEWEYNQDHFQKWCQGQTGYPIVDAAMRQLNQMAYMHNRCRMITASFLAKDLLLDWRLGEQYFMYVFAPYERYEILIDQREMLIDGDFASNNGGWGFCASTGVDPQPYFRIFNPLLQSEKFDPDGEYIRKWVPELKDIKGKAIHAPYSRGAGAIAKKVGYPRPIVDHSASRERALARYKEGLGKTTA